MDAELLPITIRPAIVGDIPLITSSWLKSMRRSFRTSDTVYYATHTPVVNALISCSDVTVAADPEDTDHVYGWACHARNNLWFVYVKQLFRHAFVARRLLTAASLDGKRITVAYAPERAAGFLAKIRAHHDPLAAVSFILEHK